ncbi:MAG: hypothetical protein A2Z34_08835 [Planctomycetes bacterium RBG_16_59_8]|nr:MAG: hypothetical protein A2Z34_08835 [Planctomycetes bacterium RBG_16_59_8]
MTRRLSFVVVVFLAVAVTSALFTPVAEAQRKKGGGKPGLGGAAEELLGQTWWAETVAEAVIRAKADDRPILLYVYPPGSEEPEFFNSSDMRKASREEAVFCKLRFRKDEKGFQRLKIAAAPMIVGLDHYGNDFSRTSTITIASARAIIRELPGVVAAFEEELAKKYEAAVAALEKDDEKKATRLLVDILSTGKHGYKDIERAAEKLEDLVEDDFAEAKKLIDSDKEAARERLAKISKEFKGTPPWIVAESMIADMENKEGKTRDAIDRLSPLLEIEALHFKKAVSDADDVMTKILKEGSLRVSETAREGQSGDKAKAKETLLKIKKEYEGTEVEKEAREAIKELR